MNYTSIFGIESDMDIIIDIAKKEQPAITLIIQAKAHVMQKRGFVTGKHFSTKFTDLPPGVCENTLKNSAKPFPYNMFFSAHVIFCN